jgi:ATP-dependent helicase/nuclease subunit A
MTEPQLLEDAELAARALDPRRSVVVSACAGSGKTWLLVARIFRLLLDGAAPSGILAITFTRKAAQEMTARLAGLLDEAAFADDAALDALLAARAVRGGDEAAQAALRTRARGLYESVLTAEPPLTVTTFHSWFLQLVQRAPLASGALAGSTLSEEGNALIEAAFERVAARAARVARRAAAADVAGAVPDVQDGTTSAAAAPAGAPAPAIPRPRLSAAFDHLFAECGLQQTRSMLRAFIAQRAQWWALARDSAEPLQVAIECLQDALPPRLRAQPDLDPYALARADPVLRADLESYRALLAVETMNATERGRAALIDAAEAHAGTAEWFAAVVRSALTKELEPYKYKPTKARQKCIGIDGEERLFAAHKRILEHLDEYRALAREQRSYVFNLAAFTCGLALLEEFERVKRQRQTMDFADLEQQACRLLTDADDAAFLHARLDARYQHLLLDEFQDTNPLQWIAVSAWLDAAQAAQSLPTVFLVGDPKQSIYRFRGAEPRLFDSAREFLQVHYGADLLEQDRSRRCAQPVIDLVNALFVDEPAFSGFRKHHAFDTVKPGRVEVLPLAAPAAAAASAQASALAWRDPLAGPRQQEDDRRAADEAAQLVAGLHRMRAHCVLDKNGVERPVRWSDILLLVRTRAKLDVYEHALREAGIPHLSSRQGGLLATLEVRDLLALLRVLAAPQQDLALAQALRSPVFALSDADLIAIAEADATESGVAAAAAVGDATEAARGDAAGPAGSDAPGAARATMARSWYARLRCHATSGQASAEVRRAALLLERWFELAATRPVHDLLDAIYFQAGVLERYRCAVAPASADAVVANLLALLEHALAAGSGRYPTLARFLDDLRELEDAPAQEAPDEATPVAQDDAVRILTVHGAKGLEAPIVWLLDSTALPRADAGYAPLIDWPAHASAPEHYSFRMRKSELGQRQQAALERAQALAEREFLNLLYVALTRARQWLVVSGHALKNGERSWYPRLRQAVCRLSGSSDEGGPISWGAALPLAAAGAAHRASAAGAGLSLPAGAVVTPADPAAAPVAGSPVIDPRLRSPFAVTPPGADEAALDSSAVRHGEAFHRIIEYLTQRPAPSDTARAAIATLTGAERDRLRETLEIDPDSFDALLASAQRVLGAPALARFFDARHYRRARNELSLIDGSGKVLRIDRLVEFEHEIWVLDYKTGERASIEAHAAAYRAQLDAYTDAIAAIYPQHALHAALVLTDGSLVPAQLLPAAQPRCV